MRMTRQGLALAGALALGALFAAEVQAQDVPSVEGYWDVRMELTESTCPAPIWDEKLGSKKFYRVTEMEQRGPRVRGRFGGESSEGRIRGNKLTFIGTHTAGMLACEIHTRSVGIIEIPSDKPNEMRGTVKNYHLCETTVPGVKCPFEQCTETGTSWATRIPTEAAYRKAAAKYMETKDEQPGNRRLPPEAELKSRLEGFCQ